VARHERVIVDLGTGDGRAALAASAADPRSLIIGIDANAAAMAEASRRAARQAKGNGQGALFVVAAAEALPHELHELADEVRIIFPWGSLLRGVLGLDEMVARGLASLLRPGGRASVTLSVTARDGLDGIASIDAGVLRRVADAQAMVGLRLVDALPATAEEIRATRSSWGRRLLAGSPDRPIWRLDFVRDAARSGRPHNG
jgi:16S rRNA (adenine(1408)-N(1))-methyltransferase